MGEFTHKQHANTYRYISVWLWSDHAMCAQSSFISEPKLSGNIPLNFYRSHISISILNENLVSCLSYCIKLVTIFRVCGNNQIWQHHSLQVEVNRWKLLEYVQNVLELPLLNPSFLIKDLSRQMHLFWVFKPEIQLETAQGDAFYSTISMHLHFCPIAWFGK